MIDFMERFNESYEKVLGLEESDHVHFFHRFYEIFTAKSPVVVEKFSQTDLRKQEQMMRRSLAFIVNFFVNNKTTEYFTNLAKIHGQNDLDIHPDLYDVWMEALLETVKEHSTNFTPETGLAWRIVLAPGIQFMKFYYDYPKSD